MFVWCGADAVEEFLLVDEHIPERDLLSTRLRFLFMTLGRTNVGGSCPKRLSFATNGHFEEPGPGKSDTSLEGIHAYIVTLTIDLFSLFK